MTIATSVMTCNTSTCTHQAFSAPKQNTKEIIFRFAQKISVVALGVIAALTSFWAFAPALGIGAIIGVITYKDTKHHDHHRHKSEASCSHGFIEQITGVKLPGSVGLVAEFSVMAVHIDHHPTVFVPIVGVTLGIWVANFAMPTVNVCFRKFAALCNKSS